MTKRTDIDLDHLRRIGWDIWNPIGLDDDWKAAALDEYDTYLWNVASMIIRGASRADAAAYLTEAALKHMGLSSANLPAACDTVDAIAAYVQKVRR